MSKWVEMELGDFVELKRGYDLPKKNREAGTVPLVSSSGESDSHNVAKVKGPGVVTGRYGTIGRVFYVEEDFWPLNTTLYVKDFKGNDPLFVYYFLKTISYSDYSDKAAVPGINRNHLHKAEIRVPIDPIYQRELAKKLWALDSKIELNRQTNQTLEHIAQAIFKSWFVDFEPTRAKIAAKQAGQDPERAAMAVISGKTLEELDAQCANTQSTHSVRGADSAASAGSAGAADPLSPEQQEQLKATAALFPDVLVDSELGEVPEGWQWSEIGNEVIVAGGGTPSTKKEEFWDGGHINWTSPKDMSNLTDKILLETARKITETGLAKISSGLLPVNTVLMSSRAPVGYLAIAKIPVAINQGYIAMKCEGELTSEYIVQWADSVMNDIKQRASGTTFAEISKKNFKIIPVIVPKKDLVVEFSAIASNLYEKISEALIEIKLLEGIRDTLLPKLLSGELTIESIQTKLERAC